MFFGMYGVSGFSTGVCAPSIPAIPHVSTRHNFFVREFMNAPFRFHST
jgi:hypothetical protein